MSNNTKNLLKSLAPTLLAFAWRNRSKIKAFIDERRSNTPLPATSR